MKQIDKVSKFLSAKCCEQFSVGNCCFYRKWCGVNTWITNCVRCTTKRILWTNKKYGIRQWAVHVVRMSEGKIMKTIFNAEPGRGRQLRGRLRTHWLYVVIENLQTLDVRGHWRNIVQDQRRWCSTTYIYAQRWRKVLPTRCQGRWKIDLKSCFLTVLFIVSLFEYQLRHYDTRCEKSSPTQTRSAKSRGIKANFSSLVAVGGRRYQDANTFSTQSSSKSRLIRMVSARVWRYRFYDWSGYILYATVAS